MSFKVGDTVGDYEVVGVLGSGGMGRVYKVRNTLSNRLEAMKVLLSEALGTADQSERFLREIRVQASLDHPNIAALRTALRIDNQLVMVMELVEGTSLQAMLGSGPIPPKAAIGYIGQALSALAYAHERGVIHRDIKPGNIMLALDGTIKLTDFGIAKVGADRTLTAAGATMGSVYYMSPEQVKGSRVLDARSDIYSLGVTFYEIVTGSRPFRGENDYAIFSAHLNDAPVPPQEKNPNVPPELSQAVLKALAKNPADRFQTATAFREALERIHGLPDQAVATRPVGAPGAAQAAAGPSASRPTASRSGGSQPSSTATLEMAYVLFMDIVAYSTLPMDRQTERITKLVEIVRGTDEFRRAHESDQIISLPTGDGMALVFFQNPIAPVQCASEVSRTLASHPEIKLRMGIHTGPVYRIADINTNRNVAGGGINMAQRVMDCGDAGHILVSKTVADTLGQLSDFAECFHDLGEAEVKHGVKVQIVNYYTSEVGNPELPQKLRKAITVQAQVVPATASAEARPGAALSPSPVVTPAAVAAPIPRPAPASSRTGLWIAVGLAAAVLVVVGAIQFSRRGITGADKNPRVPASLAPSVPSSPTPPAAPPSAGATATVPPSVPPPGASTPGATPPAAIPPTSTSPSQAVPAAPKAAAVAQAPVRQAASAGPRRTEPQAAQTAAAAPPQQGSADRAQLQELRERMIQLAARAAAVRTSVDNLERQQQASGLGLRGDMVAARESMNYLMGEARNSLAAGDVAATKKNLDTAEQQVEKLERFLGR